MSACLTEGILDAMAWLIGAEGTGITCMAVIAASSSVGRPCAFVAGIGVLAGEFLDVIAGVHGFVGGDFAGAYEDLEGRSRVDL